MADFNVPVGQLLGILGDLPEFDALRQALRAAAVEPDAPNAPGQSPYSTIDRRTIPGSALGALISETESTQHRHLKQLHDAVSIAFSAVLSGADEKVRQIVSLGEAAEAAQQWRAALTFYLVALGAAGNSPDLSLRALVQRRVGRSALNAGDFERAASYYGAGLATASVASDALGQIVASTGLGNLASLQGRWGEAHEWYANAIAICGLEHARERTQLLINQSMTLRERMLYSEAAVLLEQARASWEDMAGADRAGWYNNMGLLLLAQGESAQAELFFDRALEGEPGPFHCAMVHVNRAEVALRDGLLERAHSRCRAAEAHAIAHASPRILAEVYLQFGKIAARARDPHGIAFFELALKLTRERAYPLLLAEILYEYGRYRRELAEIASAQNLFQEALQRFGALGASTQVVQVQNELASLARTS
ncbi:MAG TPA: hypothetical protein VF021_01235 [Longimicrobiales bacterium]